MAKKWKYFDGKAWVDVSGGGGGSSHTHPNLSLLNSLTQAMVTAWNTAATWVSTNGSAVLSHIANSLLHVPSGGIAGQVLKKTQDGTEWADDSGGGGGGAALVYAGTGKSVTFALNGATAVVVRSNYSSREWSTIIPVEWMDATNKQWGIALSNTYIGLTVKNDAGACTISANYDLTCYRVVGGSAEGITDENVTMTDFDGNLREAFAFAGGALSEMQSNISYLGERTESIATGVDDLYVAVAGKASEAPQDGKTYGRKDLEWVEIGTGGNIHMSVSGDTLMISSDTSVTVSGDTLVINT